MSQGRQMVAQGGSGEFLCPHGLCEQKALNRIKSHLAHCDEIGMVFYTHRYRTRTKAICKLDDLAAYRLFKRIVGAADDKLS